MCSSMGSVESKDMQLAGDFSPVKRGREGEGREGGRERRGEVREGERSGHNYKEWTIREVQCKM